MNRARAAEVAGGRAHEHLDCRAAGALITPLPRGLFARAGREVRAGKFLESLRDRLVHRSLIGKRKLDRTATRRSLDGALRELGASYRALVRAGLSNVPAELAGAMQAVNDLETKLEAQEKDIQSLEREPSAT